MTARSIQIVEVAPRDGLQNEAATLPVEARLELIARLEAAGARRIEAVSFVNPKRVPQMAGAEELMAALPHAPGRSRIGLVLNARGWDQCVATGCDEANVVVCASDTFGVRNQGAATADQVAAMHAVAAKRAAEGGPPITATVSVAFGCPFEGDVPLDRVVAIAREAAVAGVDELALADTIGAADPWAVRAAVEAVRAAVPALPLRLHFHDTRRTALANAFAGIEAGVDILDASCGGVGGCPFAPAATGNVATEDLVHMLHRAGYETGYDLGALLATAAWLAERLGKPAPSALSRAGPFPAPAKAG